MTAAQRKRLYKARSGALPPDFPRYADLIDLVIRAEEATRAHAEMLAHWQAAGSPGDPEHCAADDLLAVHAEARYLRTRIEESLARDVAHREIEIEIARHHPREGQIVVIAHARIAKLKRRPLRLPKGLRPIEPSPEEQWIPPQLRGNSRHRSKRAGTASRTRSAPGRGSGRIRAGDPAEARRGVENSVAASTRQRQVAEIAAA